jgi:large subunit ribosomal protein L10
MPNELKTLMAEEVKAALGDSPNVLVVSLQPMDAAKDVQLRTSLRELGASLRVIHNRTSRFALDENRSGLAEYFTGQTALTLVPGEEPDLVNIAKALVDAERKKSVSVRGGYIDGELLDRAGVALLARSPDKPTLRAMLLGATMGPARSIAVALQGVAGGLARCLQEKIDKENGEEPSES